MRAVWLCSLLALVYTGLCIVAPYYVMTTAADYI